MPLCPPVVLKSKPIHGNRIAIVRSRRTLGAVQSLWRPYGRSMSILLHLLGQLGKAVPFRLAVRFDRFGVVLLFGVLMRALVEELWVHFHEKLHGVVNHTVNGAERRISTHGCER